MLAADKVRSALEALSPTQEKVDLAVKTAVEIARPSRVFIFGSWARGEAAPSSDLDLAVLVPEERNSELGELRRRISGQFEGIPMSIDLILVSEGYFAQFRSSINSLYYKIANQGKLVYEQRH